MTSSEMGLLLSEKPIFEKNSLNTSDVFICVRWEELVVVHHVRCLRLSPTFFSTFHPLFKLGDGPFTCSGKAFKVLELRYCHKLSI